MPRQARSSRTATRSWYGPRCWAGWYSGMCRMSGPSPGLALSPPAAFTPGARSAKDLTMHDEPELLFEPFPSDDLRKFVEDNVATFTMAMTGALEYQPVGFFLRE